MIKNLAKLGLLAVGLSVPLGIDALVATSRTTKIRPNEFHLVGCGMNSYVQVQAEGEFISDFIERIKPPQAATSIQIDAKNDPNYIRGIIVTPNGVEIPSGEYDRKIKPGDTVWLLPDESFYPVIQIFD